MVEIYKKILNFGCCESNFPKLETKLGKKGKLLKLMLLSTFHNNEYFELYSKWYDEKFFLLNSKPSKKIPKDLDLYFNKESLAY